MGVGDSKLDSSVPAPDCCPPGSESHSIPNPEFKLDGEMHDVQGVPLYLVGDSKADRAVLVLHDAFGFNSGRHKAFADKVAKLGYQVFLPDLFKGNPLWTSFSGISFTLQTPGALYNLAKKYNYQLVSDDIIRIMQFGKDKRGVNKWAAVGFCYGGYLIGHLAGTGKFQCVSSAHPSFDICSLTRESVPDMVQKWKCPVMLLSAGNDSSIAKPGGIIEENLKNGKRRILKESHIEEFPKMKHGWTMRSELADKEVEEETQRSFSLFSNFLNKHMSVHAESFETDDLSKDKSHHTQSGDFVNPWPSFDQVGFLNFVKWGFSRDFPDTSEKTTVNLPVVSPQWDMIRNPDPNKVQATWIGHASFLIQMDGLNILTDPIFSCRCSPSQIAGPKRIVPVPFKMEELPPIDIAVISHNHYDHLDYNTVMGLKDRVKQWYVPLRVAKWFHDSGIKNVTEMDWWDKEDFKENEKNADVVFVPCQHFSGRSLTDRSQTLWGSWVVQGPKHKMYFAGDTGIKSVPQNVKLEDEIANPDKYPICPAFQQIGEKYGPFDLACIPIGAYNPRGLMSPVHLNPIDAVQVHKLVRSKQSIAMHWGTFVLTDEPIMEPPRLLAETLEREKLKSEEFIVLKHGESKSF